MLLALVLALGLAFGQPARAEACPEVDDAARPICAQDENAVVGVATYYADDYHGRLMANGEPFDMNDPTTTASNSYPFGTLLLVTNEETGEAIVVRVTDRGSFRYPIVVDLSKAAFKSLAPLSRGVIPVSVVPVDELCGADQD